MNSRLAEAFVDRHNALDPEHPIRMTTDGGFETIPYCEKMDGFTVHVGHGPDEPCPLS